MPQPGPELSEEDALALYLLWRHGDVEPSVAWGTWPDWQFDLLSEGLKGELEMRSELSQKRGDDPLERVQSRAPDWNEADEMLEAAGE